MSDQLPVVRLFSVPVCRLGMDDTVQYIADSIRSGGKPHQVITANPIMLMAALDDAGYMSVMKQAELIVPDGTGAVWAARYVGKPVAERVAGFDLLHRLLARASVEGWRVYVLGASSETVNEAYSRLRSQYPSVAFVGCRDGYFGAGEDARVIEEIKEAAPDLLFVARSADKQEPWIARYKSELGVPVMMGVGGSFDVIAGKLKRAPGWVQRLRLEWLYRLLQEPWRYKRMLVLPIFVWKVVVNRRRIERGEW